MSSFYLNIPTTYEEWIEMGEVSFGKFYSYGGLTMLNNFLTICENKPNLLSKVKIKDDKGKEYTAEEFVVMLSDLEVIDG
tara:strand:- start:373 stop:612 length:240 start_codon:yes stop_codon:yes gene_type:complete